MKFDWKWLQLACLGLALFVAGCGTPGGQEGDVNDPAAETDAEQMEDETGEV